MASSSTASTTASQTLLAVNTSREGFSITNSDANALCIILDSVEATTANFTQRIAQYGQYEQIGPNCYKGEIRGIWEGDGAGAANVVDW
jgi:hypothetical protein